MSPTEDECDAIEAILPQDAPRGSMAAPTYPHFRHSHFVKSCGTPNLLILVDTHLGQNFLAIPFPPRLVIRHHGTLGIYQQRPQPSHPRQLLIAPQLDCLPSLPAVGPDVADTRLDDPSAALRSPGCIWLSQFNPLWAHKSCRGSGLQRCRRNRVEETFVNPSGPLP